MACRAVVVYAAFLGKAVVKKGCGASRGRASLACWNFGLLMSRSLVSRARDVALEKALLMWLRPRLKRYGDLRSLDLDSSTQTVSASILLSGEELPLVVSEARYRLERNGEQALLVLFGLKLSKPWLQNLIEDQAPEIRLRVPDLVAALLK